MALHVVFGAGQIGTPLARFLVQQGHEVRLARRAGKGLEGVTLLRGDAGDPAFAAETARGAGVVYHCMNPAYSAAVWRRELPRLATSLVGAAGRAGARLVVLDNVYAFGRPSGGRLSEDAPYAPRSRKGEIRAQVDAMLMEAHRRGDARIVVGRASDFYGPGGTNTYFGDAFWPKALQHRVARIIVGPESPHTYHYTADVVAGLATLGTAPDDVTGRWWMLPCAPAESTHAMIARFSRALGGELKIQGVPRLVVSALGLFVPFMRELAEMAYQWDGPFVMDDSRFRQRFGAAATPLDDGAARTVEWARGHYGSGK